MDRGRDRAGLFDAAEGIEGEVRGTHRRGKAGTQRLGAIDLLRRRRGATGPVGDAGIAVGNIAFAIGSGTGGAEIRGRPRWLVSDPSLRWVIATVGLVQAFGLDRLKAPAAPVNRAGGGHRGRAPETAAPALP